MQKVFVKIPGVERPYAIIGRFLFEDERFHILDDAGIRKKIPISNILYIEDVSDLIDTPGQQPTKTTATMAAEPVKSEDFASINVFFTGFKEQVFKVGSVPRELLKGTGWNVELAKIIFGNKQIQAFMGDFTVMKIDAEGENVRIQTGPLKKSAVATAPTDVPNIQSVADLAKMPAVKDKLGMLDKLMKTASNIDTKFSKPSMEYDTGFSMVSSPFDIPVSLKTNDNSGAIDGNL